MKNSHPFQTVKHLFSKKESIFKFSKYTYTPDTLFDDREIIEMQGDAISEEWVDKTIKSLKPDQELALSSLTKIRGKTLHIPMIDLAIGQIDGQEIFSRMNRYVSRSVLMNISFYSSGRSFHAYSTTLLPPKDWISFIGQLLLINPKNQPEIIDSRWIGHRLIGGYGSLRWSNNSKNYLGEPTAIRFP